jgi:hypothetical protein
MPANLNALLSRPSTPSPPDDDPSASGRVQAAGGAIQSLMQGGQPQGQGQPGLPAPNHEETVAALRHLWEFEREFKKVLATPDIGKADIKGQVLEMMADVMGEGLVTMPQVLNQLKSFPLEPLQQRQWVEQHLANVRQAGDAILAHHAAAFPWPGNEPTEANASRAVTDHTATISGLAGRYKAHATKKARR